MPPMPPAPPPAACRLGKPTVAAGELLRHPERFAGMKLIVEGHIGAVRSACTAQVCPQDRPCCNCSYTPALLERPAERIAGDTVRLELLWDPDTRREAAAPAGWFGCRQDPVSCAITCEPPTGPVRVQARLGQDAGYHWLRVSDYCSAPD
jgi:hypothetical protein